MPSAVGSLMMRSTAPRRVFGASRTVAVVNEQHVDVARVVQLRAAELAHADDGHRHVGFGELERDAEACVRERREIAADGSQVCNRQKVAARDARDLGLLPPAQGSAGSSALRSSVRRRAVFSAASCAEECLPPEHRHREAIALERCEQRSRRNRDRDDRVEQHLVAEELLGETRVRLDQSL